MKTSLLNTTILTGILGLTVIAVTGCGPLKQDPTDDYATVNKKTVESKPAHVEGPDHPIAGLVQIDIDDVLNFTEGEASSYVITPRVLLSGVNYGLAMTGAPQGATLKQKVSGHPEEGYDFSWTPAVGITNEQASFEVTFKVVIGSGSNSRSIAALEGAVMIQTAKISVKKTGKLPVVSQIKKASDTIAEGDVVAIAVTVEDPGAFGKEVPVLSIKDLRTSNKDFKFIAGAKAVVIPDAPVALGGNKFRFDLKLDSKQLALPAKTTSSDVKFVVAVTSPSGNVSASQEVSVKLNRKEVTAPTAETKAPTAPTGAKP
jgi:hypothetical protein